MYNSLTRGARSLRRSTLSTNVCSYNTQGNGIYFRFMPHDRRVSVVGVPLEFGQPLSGVSRAPLQFRMTDLQARIEREGWQFKDCGDVPIPTLASGRRQAIVQQKKQPGVPLMKFGDVVSLSNKSTAEAVYERAAAGDFVLTIGGDHSVAIGSIAGILKHRPETGIIWVDAHADINTPSSTLSGNIHGMVMSFLCKEQECMDVPEYAWLKEYPALDPQKLVYIGLRDLDLAEKVLVKQLGIKVFTMHDVDRHGIGKVMDRALEHLRGRTHNPIHLSFDIDAIDPLFAPSTGTRVGGGLTRREAYFICESIAETGLLTSMDIVEVNTALASESGAKDTLDLAKGLVFAALGDAIL